MGMRRMQVNKRRSAGQFNRRTGKTAMANKITVRRGGFRL